VKCRTMRFRGNGAANALSAASIDGTGRIWIFMQSTAITMPVAGGRHSPGARSRRYAQHWETRRSFVEARRSGVLERSE